MSCLDWRCSTSMCISGRSWTLRVEDPCDPGPEHLHAAVSREVGRDPGEAVQTEAGDPERWQEGEQR